MGVIFRQGLKHSVVALVATILGMVNTLFIYTYVLTVEELGLYRYLLSIASLAVPFLLVGLDSVSVRFFPIITAKSKKDNGFLFFLLFFILLAFLLFFIGCMVFKEEIFASYANHPNAEVIHRYLFLVPILVFSILIANILTRYVANFKLIVVPEIINNLWLKVAIPLTAIIYFLGYISFFDFLVYATVIYGFSAIFLFAYLYYLGVLDLRPNFKLYDKKLVKDIYNFAGYSLLGGMGHMIATRIDTYMVGTLIDMGNVGVYTIALFIATVIGIPLKAVFSISSPIIADLMSKNKLVEVAELYKKTSLNLFVLGLLLLIGIWCSIDLLFEIMPNGETYKAGKYIVLILGLAQIINMVTGINAHIIVYSDLYRFSFYITLLLAFLNVIFNLLFIPIYGIVGVALATLSSMFLYNLIKHFFVLSKFKMQPLTWSMLGVVGIGLIAYGTTLILPKIGNPFLAIIVNSTVITLIYVPCILYFNLSEDLANLKNNFLKKFIKR